MTSQLTSPFDEKHEYTCPYAVIRLYIVTNPIIAHIEYLYKLQNIRIV